MPLIDRDQLIESYPVLRDRHDMTVSALRYLHPNPNLPGALLQLSDHCFSLAVHMVGYVPDGPELSAGLRKLMEAKDCFVRAAL